MPRVNPRSDAGSVPSRGHGRPDRKALLICPRCGHESPVDGDWLRALEGDRYELRCPDCRELLATRPRNRGPTTR